MNPLTREISGKSCDHCVGSVRQALAALSGVEVLEVHIGRATMRVDPPAVTREQSVDAIEDQAYDVMTTGNG